MSHQQPLRPDEDEYRTEHATPEVAPSGDPLEPESPSSATSSPPWIVIGLVFLVAFVVVLVWAILLPAMR